MPRWPVDAPQHRVIKTLESLGFRIVREGNHISMVRENNDGTRTPLTLPNHRLNQGIDAADYLLASRDPARRVLEGV